MTRNERVTVKELQALFGWVDFKMPQLYTEAADREHPGIEAIDKMLPRESGAGANKKDRLCPHS